MRTLTLMLIGIALLVGCRKAPTHAPPNEVVSGEPSAAEVETSRSSSAGTVTFEIDDGNDVTSFEIENVSEGATLESVMRTIDQVPISIRGSGVTAFVDEIGGTGTNASDGWTYQIDGEFANRGIGDTKLTPPTTIKWTFGAMPDL